MVAWSAPHTMVTLVPQFTTGAWCKEYTLAPAFVSRVQAANEMTMTLNGKPAKAGDYAAR
jgi:hypothetical protein